MDVTARDIEQVEFHDAWRGYNQTEVDDFLDQIAETIDRLGRENETLRTRLREVEDSAQSARATEEMLKKTLMSAQQTAEETIAQARAKAEQLMGEAEQRVRRADEDVRRRVSVAEEDAKRKTSDITNRYEAKKRELDASVERLEAFESEIKRRLRSFMEQQLKALEALNERQARAAATPQAQPQLHRDGPSQPAVAEERPSVPPDESEPSTPDEEQEPAPSSEPERETAEPRPVAEEVVQPVQPVAAAAPAEGSEEQANLRELAADHDDTTDSAEAEGDDTSLFDFQSVEGNEEPPLDDFKPFDDDAALQGRRRRGLFRRNKVDDWA